MAKIKYSTLLEMIANKTGIPLKTVECVVIALVDYIKQSLLNGNTVIIKDFVKFKVETVARKKTYDFSSKTPRELPERNLPKASFVPRFIKQIRGSL